MTHLMHKLFQFTGQDGARRYRAETTLNGYALFVMVCPAPAAG